MTSFDKGNFLAAGIEKTDLPVSSSVAELLEMLTYCRPAGSASEKEFIARWIAPLGAAPDFYGNYWLTVGKSPILWSSHTDTVHKEIGRQRILFGDGIVSAANSSCLGADCTVGVWLMVQMARAGIPGTYIWHREEECGGKGSHFIADKTPEKLVGINFAIAFDRKGFDEIITHQFGTRGASETFAKSMMSVLAPLKFGPSDGGTFTDTANYMEIVPECTNLSVGYQSCHTPQETLKVSFAETLLNRLLTADFSKLVCARDPSAYDPSEAWWKKKSNAYSNFASDSYSRLLAYCRQYPEDVADYLDRLGIEAEDIERELYGETF